MQVEAITPDDVEFAWSDDCSIPFEHSPEAIEYRYRVTPPPNGCGGKFDGFG